MNNLGFEEIFDESNAFHLGATMYMLGNDLLIILSGIEDHIGSITLAQPYKAPLNPNIKPVNTTPDTKERISASISTLTQYHHRDDQLLSEFARSLAQKLNMVVVVTGGIHIDNITKREIKILSDLFSNIEEKIIKKVKAFQKKE